MLSRLLNSCQGGYFANFTPIFLKSLSKLKIDLILFRFIATALEQSIKEMFLDFILLNKFRLSLCKKASIKISWVKPFIVLKKSSADCLPNFLANTVIVSPITSEEVKNLVFLSFSSLYSDTARRWVKSFVSLKATKTLVSTKTLDTVGIFIVLGVARPAHGAGNPLVKSLILG